MSFEQIERPPRIDTEDGYEDFVPAEFISNPIEYFEREGENIKSGEIKRREDGTVREDPTAVKELPMWQNEMGGEIIPIGKRVNVEKGEVAESGDPFYEYRVLKIVNELGLPAPRPIAKVESNGTRLIIMEKAPGLNWYEIKNLGLKERGYTEEDFGRLRARARKMMSELKERFDEAGVVRSWKLKDMVFDLDIGAKEIRSLVPVDWERTKIETTQK